MLINLNVDESVYFETSEDIFTAIFDNLILNSWQQNKASSQIVINISIHKVGSLLKIVYEDSGVGLPPKYINDPMRIALMFSIILLTERLLGENFFFSISSSIVSIKATIF